MIELDILIIDVNTFSNLKALRIMFDLNVTILIQLASLLQIQKELRGYNYENVHWKICPRKLLTAVSLIRSAWVSAQSDQSSLCA